MEFVIELLEAEIDSLKEPYHKETNPEMKTKYSSRILQCIKALRILKQ